MVEFDSGQSERIYFSTPNDLDYLQPGDVVFIQFGKSRNGKETQSITLSPELAKTLKERRALTEEPEPVAVSPAPAAAPPAPGANRKPPTAADFTDVAEMAMIYKALRREIPEAADECICSLAQSVFKYRHERR